MELDAEKVNALLHQRFNEIKTDPKYIDELYELLWLGEHLWKGITEDYLKKLIEVFGADKLKQCEREEPQLWHV